MHQPLWLILRHQSDAEQVAPSVAEPTGLPAPVLLPCLGQVRPAPGAQLRDEPREAVVTEAAVVDEMRLYLGLVEAPGREGHMASHAGSGRNGSGRRSGARSPPPKRPVYPGVHGEG